MNDFITILENWKRNREDSGIELDELPQLQEEIFIGGFDPAERVDHSAFTSWKWDGKNLKQHGQLVWPHIRYDQIKKELDELNKKLPHERIGYDATGNVGIGSFFSENLQLVEVKLSQPTKLDAIRSMQFLLQNKIIQIKRESELANQILEQEKIITDAGNVSYKHPQGRHDDVFWSACIGAYVAIEFIVGIAPAAIEATQDIESNDVDTIIRDVMRPFAHSAYGFTWG